MEADIKKLIEQIKQDGVLQAQEEASKITKAAHAEAKQAISQARAEGQNIITRARKEAENMQKASDTALKQATRDTLLALRARVSEFFARIVKDKVAEQLQPEVIKDIIQKVVEYNIRQGITDIEIILSEKDKLAMEKTFFELLRKEARESVQLQHSKGIQGGFRVGAKGTGSYLDFTDQAIAEGFRRYLNPKLADALDIDLGIKQDTGNDK
jgi:V/A-type H+/Na+-transporting ATPase subunit E